MSIQKATSFPGHFAPVMGADEKEVFRDLSEKAPKRGSFYNVDDLTDAITEYINEHNEKPSPYIWTAKATDILAKLKRARRALKYVKTVMWGPLVIRYA